MRDSQADRNDSRREVAAKIGDREFSELHLAPQQRAHRSREWQRDKVKSGDGQCRCHTLLTEDARKRCPHGEEENCDCARQT